jgi:ferric-dicitrate binding protein FerR (iron transport regulator)
VDKHIYYMDEFNRWVALAAANPEAFEQLRRRLIEQLIAEASPRHRQRLRCLQWRIDQERRRSACPLGACIRLTRMMWNKVTARGGLIDNIQQLSGYVEGRRQPPESAQVLPLPRRMD